jgi:hypothetical protein
MFAPPTVRRKFFKFFVEHLNSWFAGTHENHENWHTTNKNEFTVFILYIIIVSTMPTFFFYEILKKKGGSREKGEEETKSMPHAPVAYSSDPNQK